jgi:tetratricopeptide (TPR) repeat protein
MKRIYGPSGPLAPIDAFFALRSRRRTISMLALLVVLAGCWGEGAEPPADEVRRLIDEQRVGEAVTRLEGLLDETPDDHELNQLYGALLLSVGEPAQAIWPLQRAAEAPDAEPLDQVLLARAHNAGGSPSDAVAVVDRLLAETPGILEAYQVRIDAYVALNRLEDALEDVEYVLQDRPNDPEMLMTRSSLLLDLERPDEAEETIAAARAALNSEGAPDAFAARFCAIGASLTFERGDEGHVERATDAWNACLEAHPSDPLVLTEAIAFFDSRGDLKRSEAILRRAIREAPRSVGYRVSLAQRLAARGEDAEALELLRQAVSSPGGLRARPMLVDYYSERGEYDKALEVLTGWIAALPEPPADLRILRADLLVRGGDFEAAEAAIAEFEKPEFRNLLGGRLALEQGDPERALALLEQAIPLWPSNPVARILAAEAAAQLGDFDRSLAEYIEALRADPGNWEALAEVEAMHRALRRPDPTVQLVNRYLGQKPKDPRGYRLAFEVGLWARREGMIRTAIQSFEAMPGGHAIAVALAARLRAARQGPAEAIALLESSRLDLTQPASAEALTVLVDNLLALSRPEAALERVDAAIAAHPDVSTFHELRGRALVAADASADEARAALERALEIEPERVPALLALGRLEAREGNLDAALAAFDAAAEADVVDSEAEWAALEALLAAGREDGVDARLEKLLADHGEHAGACELAARRIVARGGDLARARTLAERSVRLRGGAPALATLGGIYRRQGQADEAVRLLRHSLELRPESPSARYELGVALARSGDVEAARRELEKALESDGFAEEPQARAELARLGA